MEQRPDNNAFIAMQNEQPQLTPEQLHGPPSNIARKVEKENNLKPALQSLTTKHQEFLTTLYKTKNPNLPLLGPYQYSDGSTYYGNYSHGKREGFGMMIKQNGDYIYTGFWHNNKRKGKAFIIDEQRSVYKLQDASSFVSDFGVVTGKGLFKNTKGETYEGFLNNGILEGKGSYTNTHTKEKFLGDFVNGVKHGKGEQAVLNKFKYVGEFVQGKKQGKGVIKYSNGSVYKGDFLNDMKHGKGAMLTVKNAKYEGDFFNDEKHGFGVITLPNGLKYQGGMVKGKMEGIGELVYPNGKVYKGGFKGGKMHGNGQLKEANGQVVNGVWNLGNKVG